MSLCATRVYLLFVAGLLFVEVCWCSEHFSLPEQINVMQFVVLQGLYDMNVEVSGIPLLSWEPPPLSDNVKVR